MKKLILSTLIFLATFTLFAQDQLTKRQEMAKVYANIAKKEFKLSKEETNALYERKLEHYLAKDQAKKDFKAGEITKQQKNKPDQEFGKYMHQLTGKKYDELKPFYAKVNKALYSK